VYAAKGRIFNNALSVKCMLDERPSIFIRHIPIFSSERKLHKNYYHKGSVEKKNL
jgi:hypothetical protein